MARPDRHREPLVAAAGRLLRRHGYAATATSEVLRAAGATNGSLYHHFPGGKEELARAALEAATDQVERGLRGALRAAPDPASALVLWVDGLVAALEDHPRDGCPVAPTAVEAPGVGPELQGTAARAFAVWTSVLAEALEPEHGPTGAAARARVVLCAVEGALLLDRTAGTTEHLRAVRAAVPRLLA